MSIFETQRPVSATESLDKQIKLKNLRRKNLAAALEAKAEEEESSKLKKQLDDMDAQEEKKAATEGAMSLHRSRRENMLRNRALISLESDLVKKYSEEIFNQVVFEMVYNAFWLDDAVKENADIFAMYESFNAIKDIVSKVAPVSETKFIVNAKEAVTEACKKAAKRFVNELDDSVDITNIDKINFSLNDDENKDLDDNLVDLGKEEIEQLVRDKVLSVVQDERQASKDKQEFFKEVDDTLASMDAEAGEENGTTQESVMIAKRNINNKIRRLSKGTLFESIMMSCTNDLQSQAVMEGLDTKGEAFATAVLTDAIYTYTVIETLNTMGMYKIDNTNVRRLMNQFN